METNLLRSGVWSPVGMAKPDAAPFTARTLLGMEPERASRHLSMTDMAVLAAVIERLEPAGNQCPTSLYDLAMSVFGARGGEQFRLILDSLDRLVEVSLRLPGFDATRGVAVGDLVGRSTANLVQAVYVEHERMKLVKPQDLGG